MFDKHTPSAPVSILHERKDSNRRLFIPSDQISRFVYLGEYIILHKWSIKIFVETRWKPPKCDFDSYKSVNEYKNKSHFFLLWSS